MIVALDKQGTRRIARDVEKTHPNGDKQLYVCPQCKETVVLKKGMQVIHHYAHKPEHNCIFGSGESEHHYNIKMSIYDALLQHDEVESCAIELPLTDFGVRPDVFFKLKDMDKRYVAVEIQKSNIDIGTIVHRTSIYSALKISIIWIMTNLTDFYNPQPGDYIANTKEARLITSNGVINPIRYKTKDWERFLHAYYFGRMYYWKDNANVIALHHDEAYTSSGNYSKTLKTIHFLTDTFCKNKDRVISGKNFGDKYSSSEFDTYRYINEYGRLCQAYNPSEGGIILRGDTTHLSEYKEYKDFPDTLPNLNPNAKSFRALKILNLVDDFRSHYREYWNHDKYEYKSELGETNIPKTYLWRDKNKLWF